MASSTTTTTRINEAEVAPFVCVTGASQGIGKAIAIRFAQETDYNLLLIARNESKLLGTKELCERAFEERQRRSSAKQQQQQQTPEELLQRRHQREVQILPCDLAVQQQVESLQIPEQCQRIKALVNVAGSFLNKNLSQATSAEVEQQFRDNVMSAFNITTKLLPLLKNHAAISPSNSNHHDPTAASASASAASSNVNGGSEGSLIVNMCSIASVRGLPNCGPYAMSKHALLGFSRSLREELMEDRIAVTAINLGATLTPSFPSEVVELAGGERRFIHPEDVAKLVVSLAHLSPECVVEEILMRPRLGDLKL